MIPVLLSAKIRNRIIKSKNGNRVPSIKIIHWNVGTKLWTNKKTEIEALLLQEKPHMCFITEANLWNHIDTEDRQIPGHYIILPNTMISMGHARIVLLVRDDLSVHKLDEFMNTETATIWVRVGGGKNNSLVVGGIYREHQQLGRQQSDATWLERQTAQEERWNSIVTMWKKAGANCRCIAIGDINLDYLRWHNPDQFNENMVELTQSEIEMSGFVQLIGSYTRRWRHQADSLLDQIWSNCNHRVIRHFNYSRGDSDHNVVGVEVATRDLKIGGHNITKRAWKNFNKE